MAQRSMISVGGAHDKGTSMAALPEGQVFTLKQVAEWLQVTVATIRVLIHTGELQGFRVRRNWRITREALQAYMDKQQPPGNSINLC